MGDLFKDKEEQKKKEPVFNVSDYRNADVLAEEERRKRIREEQRKWIENDPNRLENRAHEMAEKNRLHQGEKEKIYHSEEEAKKSLEKDYFKITEPTVKWEEAKFPTMPEELHKIMKDILNDDKRMSKSRFGRVKEAVQNLAKADNEQLQEYFVDQLILETRDYLNKATGRTYEHRINNCSKLLSGLRELKKTYISEQESIEKKAAGNDKEAKEVIRYKSGIEALKSNLIPPYPGKSDKAKLKSYQEEINNTGIIFTMQYNKYIAACDRYLNKKNLPRDGKSYVEKLMNKAEKELKIFNNALTDFLDESRELKDITWGDAITRRVDNRVELNTKKAKNVGAGTSDVFKIKRGTSEYGYFKAEENLGRDTADCWNIIYNKYNNDKELGENERKALNGLAESLKKDFENIENEKDAAKKQAMIRSFYKEVCGGALKGYRFYNTMAVPGNKSMQEMVQKRNYNCWQYFRKLGTDDPKMVNFVAAIMEEFCRKYNSFAIATGSAKIKPGSNITGRNVATYRLAVMLGAERCVARSETAQIKFNGKDAFGNLMEEAKGKDGYDWSKSGAKYSSQCIEDMANMHVLDMICGQVDRHQGNYFLNGGAERIDSLKMIDNEMAFGNLEAGDLERGVNSLPAFDMISIAVMSDDVKKRIKDLDKKSIELLLEDVLSTEEINAASNRLKFIQEKIRLYEEENARKGRSADPKERLEKHCMGFKEYKAYKYQYEMLKKAEKIKKKEDKNPPVDKVSYLQYSNMESKAVLKKNMDNFMKQHEKDELNA